ncbi:MAG: hypothetical protein ACRD4I_08785 [Candidatus Angelobacter sp.]
MAMRLERSCNMPMAKQLRLLFYLLAMIELMLVSGLYGWERLVLR